MSNYQFYGIFCDDIRHEMGNKFTLVGCYGQDMFLRSLPTSLQRICIHFCIQSLDKSPIQSVNLELQQDNKTVHKMDLVINQSPEQHVVNGGFDLLNIEIKEKTTLSLIATVDGNTISGPSLDISLPNEETEK